LAQLLEIAADQFRVISNVEPDRWRGEERLPACARHPATTFYGGIRPQTSSSSSIRRAIGRDALPPLPAQRLAMLRDAPSQGETASCPTRGGGGGGAAGTVARGRMTSYLLRRVAYMVPTLLFISFVSVIIIQLPPGDFLDSYIAGLAEEGVSIDAEALRALQERYGLGDGFLVQYWTWMSGILTRGDFGRGRLERPGRE
jgi:hypothetical protein